MNLGGIVGIGGNYGNGGVLGVIMVMKLGSELWELRVITVMG